jgi:hypothetical protein
MEMRIATQQHLFAGPGTITAMGVIIIIIISSSSSSSSS